MTLGVRADYVRNGSASALATMASGKNPDGTDFALPVTANPAAGATPTAIASNTTDVQGVAAVAGLRLLGWSARSNAVLGNTSKTILRHGTAGGDPAIEFIHLDDDQASRAFYGAEGIACPNGIFVDRDAVNAVEITIFTRIV